MKFWDSSALVPLLVPEIFTSELEDLCLDARLGEAAQREGFNVIGRAQLQDRQPPPP